MRLIAQTIARVVDGLTIALVQKRILPIGSKADSGVLARACVSWLTQAR